MAYSFVVALLAGAVQGAQTAALPECPLEMRARFEALVSSYATKITYGAAYAGPVSNYSGDEPAPHCYMAHTAAGANGTCRGDCSSDAFPLGSSTKLWTASAVMRLYEEGAVDIDAPAFPLMEGAYLRGGGSGSLTDRFGPAILEVTARDLLGMRGSVEDFDEIDYQAEHPLEDLSPAWLADRYGNGTGQPAGSCGAYSSMSYTLLGLLLVNASGAEDWSDYDQNVWREHFPEVGFAVHGPCKDYTDVIGHFNHENQSLDASEMSCTAGYACGNMVATPLSLALFVRSLFEGELVNGTSLAAMTSYVPLGDAGQTADTVGSCDSGRGWGSGAPYGLGVMGNPLKFEDPALALRVPGHRGSTYGYVSVGAFDLEARAAIAVAAGGMSNKHKLELWTDVHGAFLADRWPLSSGDEAFVVV